MLKKLKRRFILINMLLVLAILSVLFSAILVFIYRTQVTEVTESLARALEQGNKQVRPSSPEIVSPPAPDTAPSEEREKPLPYVYADTVLVSADGTVLAQSNLENAMSEEILTEAIDAVLKKAEHTDTVLGMDLIYAKRETPAGIRIAFASSVQSTAESGTVFTVVFRI